MKRRRAGDRANGSANNFVSVSLAPSFITLLSCFSVLVFLSVIQRHLPLFLSPHPQVALFPFNQAS